MDKNIVKELEEKLRRIAYVRPEYRLPVLTPDGIYGSETEKAVGMMQERAGLPVTGKPDGETVGFINGEYESACLDSSPGKPIYPFPYAKYRAKQGERSEFVSLLSSVMRSLAGRYESAEKVACSDLYDENLKNAVSDFQKKNLLPETGETDKATWNRIAEEYNRLYCGKAVDG